MFDNKVRSNPHQIDPIIALLPLGIHWVVVTDQPLEITAGIN